MGCYNSAIINAPAEKVWAALRDFHNLDACSNLVQKLDNVGDTPGNQIGAQRVINDAFHETLVAFDDQVDFPRFGRHFLAFESP